MSTPLIARRLPGIDRALRLEDVLINAGALPLPIDLTPSMLPQPELERAEPLSNGSDSLRTAEPAPDAASTLLSEINPAPEGTSDTFAQDAVTNSLQAARDAIRDSLRTDISPRAIEAASPSGPDLLAASRPSPSAAVPEPSPAGSDNADGVPNFAHGSPAANFDLAHVVPVLFPQQTNDIADRPAEVAAVPSEIAAPATAVSDVVANLVDDAQTVVSGLAAAAGPIVGAVLNPIAAAIDAVTVPSLQGVGFDALAGLLHPQSAGPDVTVQTNASPDHLPVGDTLVPIGLGDLIPIDLGEAHAIHSLLPHAGSGLI